MVTIESVCENLIHLTIEFELISARIDLLPLKGAGAAQAEPWVTAAAKSISWVNSSTANPVTSKLDEQVVESVPKIKGKGLKLLIVHEGVGSTA